MANEFKIKKGLIVTGASGGTVVDIQGSQGQLFSVTDDLSGSIFAVSDISGVPILDINSSGLSTFDGNVNIDGSLGVGTSSPQGKLSVKAAQYRQLDFIESNNLMTIRSTAPDASYNLRGFNVEANTISLRTGATSGIVSATALTLDASQNATFANNITTDGSLNINRLAGGTPYDNFKITTADIVTTLERVENTADQANGYGRLDFKTNAAVSVSGAAGRGGYKFIDGDNNNILYLENLDKSATFGGQGFSAATSSGDASSTLTTKGYVDGLITGATIYRGAWQAGISATSSAATTASATLTVTAAILDADGNTPDLVGAVVTGEGITGIVKVASVTSSTVYVLDTAITATATAYIFSPIYGAPSLDGVTQTSGYYYICSEAGSATPNGANSEPNTWNVGDWCIYNDVSGTGQWQKIDNSSVLSGAGTGQTVALWEGPSSVTDSETLGNAPITISGNNATFAGNVDAAGNVEARGYLQAFSTLYMRGSTQIMNKNADGFLTFFARDTSGSETKMNISNVGTLSTSGDAIFAGNVTAADLLTVNGDGHLFLGASGETPKIDMMYNDHSSGAGWDTRIFTGKTDDLPNGQSFPTSTIAGGYGTQYQANSDGAFFGIIPYTAGHYRPIINWGDDATDTPFSFQFNGTNIVNISYAGTVSAPIFDGDHKGTINTATTGFTQTAGNNSTLIATTAYADAAAAAVPIGNYLPLAGGTMTGVTQFNDHTQHGDQVSAKWGAGNDLTIQHNATNSAIANSVGNLYISNHADDKDIIFECDNGSGASVSYLTLDGSTTNAYFSNPGNVGIGTTSPTAKLHVDGDLIITDTPQGQGDFLTVNPISGKVTTVSSKDISFGEAYINNYRSRVLDYGGTYFPTGAAGNVAKHKTNNLFNLMSMMLLPGGVFSGKITAAKPKTGVDFTWTRTTVANYTNEEGVITEAPIATPRIDYANNSNGEILIEPTRTNLVPNSGPGDYGNGPGSELTVPGPNGIYNSAIVPVPNNGSDRYQYTIPSGTYNDGDVFTYSWYRRRLSTPITTAYLGDLQLNVLVNCTQTGDTVQIESNISGFDRFSAEVTLTLGNTNALVRAYFGNVVGTGNSSVAYFGHQLELGDFATTLINTTGSAVTRDNDYMIVNNLSDTIFQGMVGQGGMYMDFDYKREGGADGLRFYDENNITPRVYLYQGVTGLSDSWNAGAFTLNQTSGNKIGYMFTSTTSAVYCANGSNVATSSPTAAQALDTPLDTLYIDGNQNLIRIRELSMFTQMTSAQLVTLTSL
jgi:hypothetical protein